MGEVPVQDDRPAVYYDPTVERWVYRASSLGMCERRLVAHRRGMEGQPTPEWLQRRFDEGHEFEEQILARYDEDYAGTDGFDSGEHFRVMVEIPVGKHAMIRGGTDRVHGSYVVDAKFMRPDGARQLERGMTEHPEYLWQQAAYAHGLILAGHDITTVRLAIGEKEYDPETRDAIAIDRMRYFEVGVNALPTLAQLKARVMKMEAAARKDYDVWPDCPPRFDYPCPFDWLHDERDTAVEVIDHGRMIQLGKARILHTAGKELEALAKGYKSEATQLVRGVLDAEELSPDSPQRLTAEGVGTVKWVYSRTKAAVIERYERKESVRRYPQFETGD